MNFASLSLIAKAKGLNQSDIARMAGVTRQAVSAWRQAARKNDVVDIKGSTLMALSDGLGVSPKSLNRPPPRLGEYGELWRVQFLWDRLYPSVEAFVLAVSRGEDRALARVVDRVGLFEAARIAGNAVWTDFPNYERRLHPANRAGLRRLWQLQKSLELI